MTEFILNDPNRPVGLLAVAPATYPAGSVVLTVGADKQYKTIAAAVAAARDGNVILVDAGTYTNDFATSYAKITMIGVGGMVNMVATIPPPNQKAILTVGNDLMLQNFSFSGAAVSNEAGGNGAGIRYEGGKLVLFNDAFYNNQNGLMGGAGGDGTTHEIVIDHSLFSGNGSGSGNTHNIYVGAVDKLTVTNSIFEKANVGHELKSRALENTITDNVFRNGPTGTASYEIDLPNGGVDVVRNNVIEKGPMAQNTSMVHFGGEGLPYAGSSLLLEGNTFINDSSGSTIGVLNHTSIAVSLTNNTFQDVAPNQVVRGPASVNGNVDKNGAAITNSVTTDALPGSTVTYTDTAAHTLSLTDAVRAVQGGDGRLTVTAIAGHVIASGGAGGMDFLEGKDSAVNQVTTKAGSVNSLVLNGGGTVDSRGTDTIKTGMFDTTGQVSGTATIDTGLSYDKWSVAGTATIHGHGGGPFVTVASTANVAFTGALGSLHLQNNGGAVTIDATQSGGAHDGDHISMSIAGGSVSGILWDGTTTLATAPGKTGAVLKLGDGASEVTSLGRDVIWAGAGRTSVILAGQGEVHAATGQLTIYGRGVPTEGAKVYGNGGTYLIDGQGGNITYYGGDKASTVQARLSKITMIGGAGRLTVLGGMSEQIVGGAGGLAYDAQGGSGTVTTAAKSSNTLKLGTSSIVDSWGNDTIQGGTGNDTITVHGNAVLNGGTGDRTVTLSGRDTLNGVGGNNVTVTKGANVTINSGTSTFLKEAGATVRYTLGGAKGGSVVVTGGSATINGQVDYGLFIGTDAKVSTNVALGTGNATLTASGADVVRGGAGSATISINGANAQVFGGKGALTVTDGALGMRFVGGAGKASLSLWAGGGQIIFGAGNTTVYGGSGNADTFQFIGGKGGGTDVINGFRVGVDRLVLAGVAVKSQSVGGGNANLLLTDGTHVQLAGLTNLGKVFG